MSITVLILVFLCGKASNETGRFHGGGIQRGQDLPWHTILLARSSVLYLLRRAATEGACDVVGAPCAPAQKRQTLLAVAVSSTVLRGSSSPNRTRFAGLRFGGNGDAGQAGFAGLMAENAGACEKQSPPGRQRLRALGWSEAEEKRAQPSCRRYIKTLVPRLSFSAFSFFGAIAFLIFRFWMNARFLHYAFSESNHIQEYHSQMNCPQLILNLRQVRLINRKLASPNLLRRLFGGGIIIRAGQNRAA